MKSRLLPILAVVALVATRLAPSLAASETLYWQSGHGDIRPIYTAGDSFFDLRWHLDSGSHINGEPLPAAKAFLPQELVLHVVKETTASALDASALGVAVGAPVWRSGNNTYTPNHGFASYDLPWSWADSDGMGDPAVTLFLHGVTGPGAVVGADRHYIHFASDPNFSVADNSYLLGVGNHLHFNWFFSQPGYYELEFGWSGTYTGGSEPTAVAGRDLFGFHVGPLPEPIPEPGALGLLVLGAGALAWRRFGRRRVAGIGQPKARKDEIEGLQSSHFSSQS